jgi:hypothetical protein
LCGAASNPAEVPVRLHPIPSAILPCLLAAAAAAGCGGAVKAKQAEPVIHQRTATPTGAKDCLNMDQFIVEMDKPTVLTGSAPDAVTFVVKFYRSDAQAAAAAQRMHPRYTATMGKAVIDFRGNPPAHKGGLPRILIRLDLVTLRHCLLPR